MIQIALASFVKPFSKGWSTKAQKCTRILGWYSENAEPLVRLAEWSAHLITCDPKNEVFLFLLGFTTLPKFNSSPLKSYRNPIGKDRLPTIIFRGYVKLPGGKGWFKFHFLHSRNTFPAQARWAAVNGHTHKGVPCWNIARLFIGWFTWTSLLCKFGISSFSGCHLLCSIGVINKSQVPKGL